MVSVTNAAVSAADDAATVTLERDEVLMLASLLGCDDGKIT